MELRDFARKTTKFFSSNIVIKNFELLELKLIHLNVWTILKLTSYYYY